MTWDQLESRLAEKTRAEFASLFLQEYLTRGLGSMTKRDVDILVLHLLDKLGVTEDSTNHEASIELQITESRVRSLRYDARLRYPPEDDKYIERRVLWALVRSDFVPDQGRIKFIIEDTYVRYGLQARMKSRGGVPDSSFNREIVSVTPEQLAGVLAELFGEKAAKDFDAQFKKVISDKSKITFAELRKSFALGAAKGLGGGVVKAIKAYFAGDPT